MARKSGPTKFSDPPHPLKHRGPTGMRWHWPSVVDEIEARYLGVSAALPLWEILEAPYVDQAGVEWTMPNKVEVYRAMARDPEIKARVEEVKRARSLALGDALLDCVRVPTTVDTEKGPAPNTAGVQLARLKYDAYKWYLGVLNPGEYGNKQQVEHSGSIDSPALAAVLQNSGPPKPKGDGT
jgi:hypothetical protein